MRLALGAPGGHVRDGCRRPNVLLVDDDADMRALLKVVLEAEGYRVLEAGGGDEAAALASQRVDAVILDKEMPGASGFEVLARLRRRHPEVPVIFITAFGGRRAAEQALRGGARCYLEKPVRMAEIVDAVARVTLEPGETLATRGNRPGEAEAGR